jgi:hypothetical protein
MPSANDPSPPSFKFSYPGSKPIEITAEMLDREHTLGHSDVDWTPNPETITVAETLQLTHNLGKASEIMQIAPTPSVFGFLRRREMVASSNPGFGEFERWARTRFGRRADLEVARELEFELARAVRCGLSGQARSLAHRLAASTGLRYPEVASITPESFD